MKIFVTVTLNRIFGLDIVKVRCACTFDTLLLETRINFQRKEAIVSGGRQTEIKRQRHWQGNHEQITILISLTEIVFL